MNFPEASYLSLLSKIFHTGIDKDSRPGIRTRSLFGEQMIFNLYQGFPLLTTKKINHKAVFAELCWFLSGSSNVHDLWKNDVHIWDEWADPETGELGPVYGKQWRRWRHWRLATEDELLDRDPIIDDSVQLMIPEDHDQIVDVLRRLASDPDDRRIIVNAWNVGELAQMKLPPCHLLFQFYVHEEGGQRFLSCKLYQRSADMFLGVPFNIASYAALVHVIARRVNMVPHRLIMTFGDTHIYHNHLEQVEEQLLRQPYAPPRLELATEMDSVPLDELDWTMFKVINYKHHPPIRGEVAV